MINAPYSDGRQLKFAPFYENERLRTLVLRPLTGQEQASRANFCVSWDLLEREERMKKIHPPPSLDYRNLSKRAISFSQFINSYTQSDGRRSASLLLSLLLVLVLFRLMEVKALVLSRSSSK
jgi:hypothetical protein